MKSVWNKEPQERNARIESTMLGFEDHGILTCFLMLDYGGSGQGFGGYSLDTPNGKEGKEFARIGTSYGMEFIRRILNILEVDKWENLKGQHIRVVSDMGKVHSIGHIIKDKWFRPETDLKNFTGAL